MRYAIFSDIHGNLVAWKAALADMEELEADVLVCLGDVVGYGPCPQEVLSAIRQRTDHFVVGNHDAAASGVLDTSLFNENARAVIEWTREQLDEESVEFLLNVPLSLETEDILFVHAEINEPGKFGYIDSVVEAVENFAANQHFVTFVGHTHHPTIFELNSDGGVQQLPDEDCTLDPNKRYIINVGSVGEPRNPNDLRSRYLIYDSDTCEVYFRRIEFDPEEYRAHLHASGLQITPYFLTVVDHYLQAAEEGPSEEEMYALTHDMEAPLEVANSFQGQPQQMVVEVDPITAARRKPKPKPRPIPAQQRKVGAAPFVLIFTSAVALLGAGWYFLFGREQLADDPAAAGPTVAQPAMVVETPIEVAPPNPDPVPAPPPPEPTGPETTLKNGLIAQWKLDDSPGTKWFSDSAGNDLDLFLEGPESVANGVTGRAQKFDGKDDKLTSADTPFEGRDPKKLAISGWFSSVSQDPRHERLVAIEGKYFVGVTKGKIYAKFAKDGDARPGGRQNYRDGAWRHFLAQNDGKKTELFIDGELAASTAQTFEPLGQSASPIALGSSSKGDRLWFNGFLDEVALWDRTLTKEEIAHLYKIGSGGKAPQPVLANVPQLPEPPKPPVVEPYPRKWFVDSTSKFKRGLLAYWRMDVSANSKVVPDQTGNGFDLTIHGATPNQGGELDKAIRLEAGKKNHLSSKPDIFKHSKQITIAGWFRRAGRSKGFLVSVEGLGNVLLFDDSLEAVFDGGRNAAAKTGIGGPNNNWYHFAVTHNGTHAAVFVNGVVKKRAKIAFGNLDAQNRSVRIGSNWKGDNSFFNGWIDEVAVWNRALSGAEIAALYAAGNSDFSFLTPAQPIAYWRMDDQSAAPRLVDSLGNHNLVRIEGGAQVAPIGPATIPQTGATNAKAQRGGAWGSPEIDGTFALTRDQGFTLECWIRAEPVSKIVVLAGTRTGDVNGSQGWQLDLRPPAKKGGTGAVGFLYDNGPSGKQVVTKDVPIFDGKSHHIAIGWAPHWGEEAEGKMHIFVDGKWLPSGSLQLKDIPEKQANRFQIGMPGNQAEGVIVDEVRFTPAMMKPAISLRGRKGSLEMRAQK